MACRGIGGGSSSSTGGSVDAVLVDVPELVVHGVVDSTVAGAGRLDGGEVAGGENGAVGAVGDHGVGPPVGNSADAVVVVVRHRVADLRDR